MKNIKVENIRLVMKAYSFVQGYVMGMFPDKKEVKEGFSAIYGIDETRYPLSQIFYKIGLKSKNYTIHSDTFYTSDLQNILKRENKSSVAIESGFYEIADLADLSLEALDGKNIVMDMVGFKNVRSEEQETPEAVIHIQKVTRIFRADAVKITNLTTPKNNDEDLLSIDEFNTLMLNVNPRSFNRISYDWLEEQVEKAQDYA